MPDARLLAERKPMSRWTEPKAGTLNQAAIRWFGELPEAVRPNETALRFPHIANSLCTRWLTPLPCREYFQELLLDTRGDRRGFPPQVVRELVALKDYYETAVFPIEQTAWDELAKQSRG